MLFPLKLGKTALAEVLMPSGRLADTLAFFVDVLGFRVETIFPAEEPEVASLSGHGIRVRLSPDGGDPGVIRLLCDDPQAIQESPLVAPNGTRIELVEKDAPVIVPPLRPTFVLTRPGGGPAAGAGRAGMIYRDLIPDRQVGSSPPTSLCLRAGRWRTGCIFTRFGSR
jgi:catechol 2,3-dioxygenase-like lactoylglutathione lyase family enzyme